MADAATAPPAEAKKLAVDEEAKPVEEAPAENGNSVDDAEPPKKRGRPSSGSSRKTPKRVKKVKIPQEPTRRSTRRSISRSSEASTPTEKKEEPIEIAAEKENVEDNKAESKEEAPEESKSEENNADDEKSEPAVEQAKPVEAEA